ncbi:MAG: type IV pilus secretin PilQ [Nitrospinae bacterium]|nr:type IV pilus secretin PilQ [Nitrospinota bacterium]
MNTLIKNQFMFGLIAVILGAGLVFSTVHGAQADTGSKKTAQSATGNKAVAKKSIQIIPTKGNMSQRMLMAQAAGENSAGALSRIVDLQTAQENGEVSIRLRSSQGLEYTAFKLVDPLRLVLDFPNMEKGELSGVMEVNQGVVNSIKPLYFEEAKVLRLEIGLNKAASYEILRPSSYEMVIRLKDTSAPAQEAQAPQEQAEAAPAPEPMAMASSEPAAELEEDKGVEMDSCAPLLGGVKDSFSMDFQNANIKNIFRIISEVSGFNLVLSPEVGGDVNIRLIDVPWNQAFEIILKNAALGRVCEGNIIRIVSNATLLAAQVAEPLITEMIRINYADIAEMVKNLAGLKSPRGSITADVRTNTLILTDIPDKVEEMLSVIKTLDVRTPQVMIEAKIVEVTRNYAQEIGIKWGAFTERSTGGADAFPAVIKTGGFNPVARVTNPNERVTRNQDSTNFNQPFLTPADGFVPIDPGYIVDLGTPSTPTGVIGILLSTLNQDHVLDIQLEALERQGKSRTIANPKVTTLDNKEAKIQSGQRIPVQTSSANEGTKVQFVDANLELKVTPHITADENIYMKILATQNNADFGATVLGIPTIITKEASTEVLVANGATTVLGGLYQKITSENRGSVPFFANIPIIGYLFRNRTESDDISELLIFVTPTIVRVDGSFSK